MQFSLSTYIPGNSIIHRGDARVKLVFLLAYSITLFFIQTWIGLFLYIALCLVASMIARIPAGRLFTLLIPLYVILAFTLIFNSFTFDVSKVGEMYGLGEVSAGVFIYFEPIAFVGTFGFVPIGFARGCFFVLRIMFLMLASLVVTLTTTSNDLIDALNDFLHPLHALRVPTDDIATIVSIAIRFIPITAEETMKVYAAQKSRGAAFGEGGLLHRIKAWHPILVPLFVGLFRRAENLALAMESRCYGLAEKRTRLHPRVFTFGAAGFLLIGVSFFGACALWL